MTTRPNLGRRASRQTLRRSRRLLSQDAHGPRSADRELPVEPSLASRPGRGTIVVSLHPWGSGKEAPGRIPTRGAVVTKVMPGLGGPSRLRVGRRCAVPGRRATLPAPGLRSQLLRAVHPSWTGPLRPNRPAVSPAPRPDSPEGLPAFSGRSEVTDAPTVPSTTTRLEGFSTASTQGGRKPGLADTQRGASRRTRFPRPLSPYARKPTGGMEGGGTETCGAPTAAQLERRST